MSIARCACKAVGLRFLKRAPVLHLECGCCDCKQAHEYMASLGGPQTPSPPMQQLYYFANDVAPLSAEELERVRITKLRASLGRASAPSIRLETTCCNSILAVNHAAYQGNVVMVPSGACELDAPDLAPLARIYMNDWDTAVDGPPPPLPEGCIEPVQGGPKPWYDIMSTPLDTLLDGAPRSGQPIQALFDQLAPTLTVHGLPEGTRLAPPAANVKRVHFLRHGQAMHNPRAEAARHGDPPCSFDEFLQLMKEDDAFDADLTELGRAQASGAAQTPLGAKVDASVQLVVSSPLSRAIDTAMLVLPRATAQGPTKFLAHDDLRERSGWMLNAKRRTRTELASKYPGCDITSYLPDDEDTLWKEEELEDPIDTAERGFRFLCWLSKRPETDVAVVAHGGLFHYLLNSLKPRVVASDAAAQRFGNCELRSLLMVWGCDQKDGEARTFKLVEHESE